jgi:hypothetical protein
MSGSRHSAGRLAARHSSRYQHPRIPVRVATCRSAREAQQEWLCAAGYLRNLAVRGLAVLRRRGGQLEFESFRLANIEGRSLSSQVIWKDSGNASSKWSATLRAPVSGRMRIPASPEYAGETLARPSQPLGVRSRARRAGSRAHPAALLNSWRLQHNARQCNALWRVS